MQTLKNKVALVTGGSRGMGAAIVKRLAQDGASVAFTYVAATEKAERLIQELSEKGFQAIAIKADNAEEGAVTAAIEKAIGTFGKLDILVNNAGMYIGKPFEEHTFDDYDQTMAVNVRAVVEACLAASRKMEANGRIITIGSSMAERVPFANGTLYAMSKAALTGFTKGLARDLGPKGITVNLVQPGPVNTDMNPENGASADFQRSLLAIPKYGTPEQIANLIAYLAHPDNSYTTGSIFTIDGGTTC